ncbi:MAG: hypothetical protein ACOYUB_01390 [Patescibacteria group bacterium]
MKMAYYLVVLVRIIVAPLILIWPTPGIILSLFLDIIDADFAYHVITKKQYQVIDKLLDLWVYVFEMIIAWNTLPEFRMVLLALLTWRTIGLALMIMTSNRHILIFFGNYFENIFFLVYFAKNVKGLDFLVSNPTAFWISIAVTVLAKAFQEWFIHVADLSIREDLFKSKRKWKK